MLMQGQGSSGILHAQPVGLLLQLLLGCGEAPERLATLQALQTAIGEPQSYLVQQYCLPPSQLPVSGVESLVQCLLRSPAADGLGCGEAPERLAILHALQTAIGEPI